MRGDISGFLDGLKSYPFHMPGHKRNESLFPSLPLRRDITEISGADNLHSPQGIIKSSMEKAAALWGARRSYYLVNGSSCGILAGISALTRRGDKALIQRSCHRSVFNAIELCGLSPLYLMPEYVGEAGVCGSLSPETVRAALDKNPEAVLLVAVSPTYEGVISDLPSIASLCRERGVFLLVDEAHGAHLDLSPHFTGGAVAAGADIVVQSLHKTLPALTQTAILHVNGDRVDTERLERKLRTFESSSPSYLLMESAEYAVLAAQNPRLFGRWRALIDEFEEKISGLKHIKLALRQKTASIFDFDRSKLMLSGVNGRALFDFLRAGGIEAEYASDSFVLAMTGPGDTAEGFALLSDTLAKADSVLPPSSPEAAPPFTCPDTVCPIEAALDGPAEIVPSMSCAGRTAAEYIWAYPPGIPLLIPGEAIPPAFAESAKSFVFLHSDSCALPDGVKVLCL